MTQREIMQGILLAAALFAVLIVLPSCSTIQPVQAEAAPERGGPNATIFNIGNGAYMICATDGKCLSPYGVWWLECVMPDNGTDLDLNTCVKRGDYGIPISELGDKGTLI